MITTIVSFFLIVSIVYGWIPLKVPLTFRTKGFSLHMAEKMIRRLGSYETLLSRNIPNTNYFALSHSSVVFLNGICDERVLREAVAFVLLRHPILRVGIKTIKENEKYFYELPNSLSELSRQIIEPVQVEDSIENTCQRLMEDSLNRLSFGGDRPQWRLHHVIGNENIKRSAWIFALNHGIDDQSSVNLIINDLLGYINSSEKPSYNATPSSFPLSIEEGITRSSLVPNLKTIGWTAHQIFNSLQSPSMIPEAIKRLNAKDIERYSTEKRRTIIKLFSIPKEVMASLQVCLKRHSSHQSAIGKFTVTHVLSAAMLYCTNLAITRFGNSEEHISSGESNPLRFLLSVGLRPYSQLIDPESNQIADFTRGSVACASGAVDFIVPVNNNSTDFVYHSLLDEDRGNLIEESTRSFAKEFWQTVAYCASKSKDIIQEREWVPESVRLFDIGMHTVDILQAVEIDAQNKKGLGRGFSCGVSNMGKVQLGTTRQTSNLSSTLLKVESCFYGTSHHRNGVLCQLSCMTIEDAFHGCLQFPAPIITQIEASTFQTFFERFIQFLTTL